ncbi:hypothetical protein EX30DRAFT_205646 [Ascodesmis nigricans]|uniref:Uncharacterized protein n=1 Tax=Ascodesmis nigricans TaxID=341454 RepID=A0A4S2MK12_9PEZI|nr:hypothetical protein EX30DRAFT_205646 [Ascodesmis nigricans]
MWVEDRAVRLLRDSHRRISNPPASSIPHQFCELLAYPHGWNSEGVASDGNNIICQWIAKETSQARVAAAVAAHRQVCPLAFESDDASSFAGSLGLSLSTSSLRITYSALSFSLRQTVLASRFHDHFRHSTVAAARACSKPGIRGGDSVRISEGRTTSLVVQPRVIPVQVAAINTCGEADQVSGSSVVRLPCARFWATMSLFHGHAPTWAAWSPSLSKDTSCAEYRLHASGSASCWQFNMFSFGVRMCWHGFFSAHTPEVEGAFIFFRIKHGYLSLSRSGTRAYPVRNFGDVGKSWRAKIIHPPSLLPLPGMSYAEIDENQQLSTR